MRAISGIRTVPTGSMCLSGFNVTRPSMRAVGSPHRDAIQACADSWMLIANKNAIRSGNTHSTIVQRRHPKFFDSNRLVPKIFLFVLCLQSLTHFWKFTNRS